MTDLREKVENILLDFRHGHGVGLTDTTDAIMALVQPVVTDEMVEAARAAEEAVVCSGEVYTEADRLKAALTAALPHAVTREQVIEELAVEAEKESAPKQEGGRVFTVTVGPDGQFQNSPIHLHTPRSAMIVRPGQREIITPPPSPSASPSPALWRLTMTEDKFTRFRLALFDMSAAMRKQSKATHVAAARIGEALSKMRDTREILIARLKTARARPAPTTQKSPARKPR